MDFQKYLLLLMEKASKEYILYLMTECQKIQKKEKMFDYLYEFV